MQGSSSVFYPFPLGQQKQRQTSEAWVLYFFFLLPPQGFKGSSSLFYPFPLGQQKQRQTSEAWGAEVFLSPFPRRDAGPLISFFSFLARGTKAADERSLGAVAPLLLLLLPPQGCKAPHLFFTHSPSVNKSKGRRAKPGCCRSFSFSPRKDPRPLISFLPFPPRATKAKADERSLGAVDFSPSPPAKMQGPSSFEFSALVIRGLDDA